jgi:nucleoid DNA-binding protein
MTTLTKAHIVENLFARNLFSKTQSTQNSETLFELMKQSLAEGDDILISGFGRSSNEEGETLKLENLWCYLPARWSRSSVPGS